MVTESARRRTRLGTLFMAALVLGATSTSAPSSARASPFDAGRTQASLAAGAGTVGSERYWVIGGGITFFALTGVGLGLEVEQWVGEPSITKVSPSLRFVLPGETVHPYVGGFYRRWLVADYGDIDSVGARAGIYYTPNPGFYLGAGLIYERVVAPACDTGCTSTLPEVALAVGF